MIAYLIVGFVIPIWVSGTLAFYVSLIADLMFQKKKRRPLEFLKRFVFGTLWPLALVNKSGRREVLDMVHKIF